MSSSVARIGLGIGGALTGGFLFGPIGAAVGFTVGNTAGGLIFGDERDDDVLEGPRLDDLTVTTSTYGRMIAITYGRVRVGTNMIWSTDIVEKKTVTEVEVGGGGKGKGGGKSSDTQEQTEFTYFLNAAFAVSEGPIEAITRIWMNNELIVDLRDTSAGSGIYEIPSRHFRFYFGDETQEPDPLIESFEGVGNVPAHRGLAYIVLDEMPLEDFGNRAPKIEVEVVSKASESFQTINYTSAFINTGEGRMDYAGRRLVSINNGSSIGVMNRVTGVMEHNFNLNTSQEFLDFLTANGLNTQIATSGSDSWFDPVNGDIYTGHEGTTLQGGGYAVWDKNMQFVTFRHLGEFGGNKGGWVLPMGNTRYIISVWGLGNGFNQAEKLTVDRWTFSADPTENRGTLQLNISGPTTTGTSADWAMVAYDPLGLPEGGRAWVITWPDFNNDMWIVDINFDGKIGTPVNLTTKGIDGTKVIYMLAFDLVTETLILVQFDRILKLDPNNYTILDTVTVANDGFGVGGNTSSNGFHIMGKNTPTVSGEINVVDIFGIYSRHSTIDPRIRKKRILDTDHTASAAWDDAVWDPLIQCLWDAPVETTFSQYFFDRFSSNTVTLSDIVSNLSQRGGLAAPEIDTSALTDTVRGYKITSAKTARAVIENLMRVYLFDGAEIDHKLIYKKRGGASTKTVTTDEMVLGKDGKSTDEEVVLVERRRQDVDIPRQVNLTILDDANDYQALTQSDQRALEDPARTLNPNLPGITRSTEVSDINVPVVMIEDEAKDAVAKMIRSGWVERRDLEFKLPPKFIDLAPTDVITVQKTTTALISNFLLRILRIDEADAGVLDVRGVLQDSATFTPNTVGSAAEGKAPAPLIGLFAETEFFLLNLPNLRGFQDEGGGAWFAAGPDLETAGLKWRSASLFCSVVSEGPFSQAAFVNTKIKHGFVLQQVAVQSQWTVFDNVNTIDIQFLTTNLPVSLDFNTFTLGGNLLYFVTTGELMQFQNVTDLGNQRVRVDTLLRARLGTDHNMTTVTTRSAIVMIDTNLMDHFGDITDRNIQRFYRAVSFGSNIEDKLQSRAFTNMSESLKPYPVALNENSGSYSAATGDIIITWNRRTRFDGALQDNVEIPLNETIEEYEIDILDAPGGNVVHSFTGVGSGKTVTYTKTDRETDFPASATSFASINNNSFETGDLTNWTIVSGNWSNQAEGANGISGADGTRMVQLLNDGFTTIREIKHDDIAVPVALEAQIDAGDIEVEWKWLWSSNSSSGSVGVRIEFLNASLVDLGGEIDTGVSSNVSQNLIEHTIQVSVPRLTRFMRVRGFGANLTNAPALDNFRAEYITATSPLATLDVVGYQVSSRVGRGNPRRVALKLKG